MEEVDETTQAEMAIKLSDNVRDLVRQHMRDALQDQNFLATINPYLLSEAVLQNLNSSNFAFQQAVKTIIANQMNKY